MTGRLSKGTIVRVIGKYKKWVEVTWNDDSGEAQEKPLLLNRVKKMAQDIMRCPALFLCPASGHGRCRESYQHWRWPSAVLSGNP